MSDKRKIQELPINNIDKMRLTYCKKWNENENYLKDHEKQSKI